jgi:cytoskeletal protein RodZ
MGIVRVSGRGRFVCHGSVVMAGWRCLQRDASSRWLIVIKNRPFPTDADHDRGANPYVRGESEPLAELAQLIGQTDPFGTQAKPLLPLQSRANVHPQYALAEEEANTLAGPPPWRQRDALYGPIKSVEQENAGDPAYPDDPYAYQRGYDQEPEPRTRSGWVVTVAAVLALAVVGTGAAFAYRTYVGSPRSGEPPIITADNSPTKVVPAQSDGGASKIPDRMPSGGGGERLVSREEAPVDINSRSGASLVEIPPLNQNSSPPPVARVSPTGPALATAANGTVPNNEPRKIKALTVKGDAAENGGIPVGAVAPAKPDPAVRSASAPVAPAQRNPSAGGGYLVQVSSQKNEADAQVSYRALQNKFPAALRSRPPVIKRADLGDKGVYYRTMVGPFGSTEEAAQLCGNLKSAGGQCLIQKN